MSRIRGYTNKKIRDPRNSSRRKYRKFRFSQYLNANWPRRLSNKIWVAKEWRVRASWEQIGSQIKNSKIENTKHSIFLLVSYIKSEKYLVPKKITKVSSQLSNLVSWSLNVEHVRWGEVRQSSQGRNIYHVRDHILLQTMKTWKAHKGFNLYILVVTWPLNMDMHCTVTTFIFL